MRLSDLAVATGGTLTGSDLEFDSVSIDTRTLSPGDLYIAIPGPRFDGHQFVQQARERGACAAMVEHPVDCDLPTVVVANARLALGAMGTFHRCALPVRVVGLTGSNGKTTVKEMTAAILSRCGQTLSTRGNLNNDFGVPLTLARLTAEHQFAVIEMGANHLGEIAYVAALTKPDVALITNAGTAHLEGFGSREGIARGKGEIISALGPEGVAILNADDRFLPLWRELAGDRRVLTFGYGAGADFRGEEASVRVVTEGDGFVTRFSSICAGRPQTFSLRLAGSHNVVNALAAVAAAYALGVDLRDAAAALTEMEPVAGRLNPIRGDSGALIVDDTYNANPSSFRAALEVLLQLPGKPWVALGAFGELGPDSPELHAELGREARLRGVHRLLATGPNAERCVEAFGSGAVFYPEQDAMIEALEAELTDDAVLLVKGSRSQRMERVVAALSHRRHENLNAAETH